VAGATGGDEAAQSVAQLGQMAGAGYIASYGRDQERQSDEVGQTLAAASGWDPAAMAAFLDTLERESVLRTGQVRPPSFLDSHPVTRERVQTTATRARGLERTPGAPVARSTADFLGRIDGILVGADPAEGVFRDGRFLHPGLGFTFEPPPGWQVQNTKQAVAAVSPGQDALLVLELQGPSGDPGQAAAAFAREKQLQLTAGSAGTTQGGWRAYRAATVAQTQQGPTDLDLTWVAHPSAMFRLTGMTQQGNAGRYVQSFLETARSFRPLSNAERASITELRLRVVAARGGESLGALSRRTGNAWSLNETAVANGLEPSARLSAGAPIKIAVQVPYRS